MGTSNRSEFTNFKIETLITPFTPSRPTHVCHDADNLPKLINKLNGQDFYSARQISIAENQDGLWVPVASRFNNTWYVSTGAFRG